MNNADYPVGADDENAPWNQEQQPDHEIEVTIFMSISKTVKIKVNDYKEEREKEDSGYTSYYDYSDCDIYKAVKEQVEFPKLEEDNWEVEDLEVVLS